MFFFSLFQIFGGVTPPYTNPAGNPYPAGMEGIVIFGTNILRLVFLIAGLFSFIKIVIAGFGFISAGGDPKAITKAWDNIWQALVGLLIIVSSFILTAIVGQVFFGDFTYILNPVLYGVGP